MKVLNKFCIILILLITLTNCESIGPVSMNKIATGQEHTCYINNQLNAICWGSNSHGQSNPIGGSCLKEDNDICKGNKSISDTEYSQLSLGSLHSCGLTIHKAIECWGDNSLNQLQSPKGNNFLKIAAGTFHTCALDESGEILCWGLNLHGQSLTPENQVFTDVSAGANYSCGITDKEQIYCWGDNYYEQSNDFIGQFVQISSSGLHSCAIRWDGKVVCWGKNDKRQSNPPGGTCSYTECTGFKSVSNKTYVSISTGSKTSCGITEEQRIVCWGNERSKVNPSELFRSDFNQFSNENTKAKYDESVQYQEVSVSKYHVCAIDINDNLNCWGKNDFGQTNIPQMLINNNL
jgi:alpha-tubulin suppressor-like RCC1 family protein